MREPSGALYFVKGVSGIGIFMLFVYFFTRWWGWSTGPIAGALAVALAIIIIGKLLFERGDHEDQ